MRRPPVTIRPLKGAIGSTPSSKAVRICVAVALGSTDHARAATPLTCGVAMLVPLYESYPPPGTVLAAGDGDVWVLCEPELDPI